MDEEKSALYRVLYDSSRDKTGSDLTPSGQTEITFSRHWLLPKEMRALIRAIHAKFSVNMPLCLTSHENLIDFVHGGRYTTSEDRGSEPVTAFVGKIR